MSAGTDFLASLQKKTVKSTVQQKQQKRANASAVDKRSDLNGNVVYIDAPYKVYGFSIQYRRYLTTAAKRERKEAV